MVKVSVVDFARMQLRQLHIALAVEVSLASSNGLGRLLNHPADRFVDLHFDDMKILLKPKLSIVIDPHTAASIPTSVITPIDPR